MNIEYIIISRKHTNPYHNIVIKIRYKFNWGMIVKNNYDLLIKIKHLVYNY